MNANWLIVCCWSWLAVVAWGQQSLESIYRTTGTQVVAAFNEQRKVLQTSSAVILDGRDEIACGVVISADGYILTKASEILETKALSVTVDEANYREVKVVVIDPTWDVALLKVDASSLVPVIFAPTSAVPQGTWVVANGATTRKVRRLLAGIVSAKPREIPAAGGLALGVVLDLKSKQLTIGEVNEKSGAKEAGLEKGDVILSIDETKVKKLEDIAAALKDKKSGAVVRVTFRRKKEEKAVDVRLSAKGEIYSDQLTRNDEMSGDFSSRRSGFPRVMQTDLLGNSKIQGGPLLDLEGRCLGMNIARANRAESFAIPVEELKEITERLLKQAGN